jgi:hypothetical protein
MRAWKAGGNALFLGLDMGRIIPDIGLKLQGLDKMGQTW